MGHLRAGRHIEQGAGEVIVAADARRAVVKFAGIFFCKLDKLAHGFYRQRGMHYQYQRRSADAAHRNNCTRRVKRQLRAHRGGAGVRRGVAEQHMTVGIGFGDLLGADHAGSAGPVVDYDVAAPDLGQLGSDRARHDVD